jgi:mono/diheme cytochrome c family protein
MTARLLFNGIAAMACLVLFSGCTLPGRPKPGPEVVRPDEIVDFPTLYAQNCVGCHGAKGTDGPSYPLANPEYQAIVDESTLRQIVAQGDPGTLMPPFAATAGGMLTDQQISVLADGMRAAWYKHDVLAGQNPPPYKARLTGDAGRGKQAYATYCATCHGAAGQAAPGKAGSITNAAFLALVNDQALRTITIAGRPDIGQPDWRSDLPGHPMTDQEVTDVVAWLSSQRPGPTAAANGRRPGSADQSTARTQATPALAFQQASKTQKNGAGGAE